MRWIERDTKQRICGAPTPATGPCSTPSSRAKEAKPDQLRRKRFHCIKELRNKHIFMYMLTFYRTFEILKPPGTSFWKTPKGSYFFAAAFIFFTFSEP
jgi:hypothetical protein